MLYTTPFYKSKISIPNRSAGLFGKENWVKRQDCSIQKSQVSKVAICLSFNRSNYKDHQNSLGSKKPRLFKALIGSFQALSSIFQDFCAK